MTILYPAPYKWLALNMVEYARLGIEICQAIMDGASGTVANSMRQVRYSKENLTFCEERYPLFSSFSSEEVYPLTWTVYLDHSEEEY